MNRKFFCTKVKQRNSDQAIEFVVFLANAKDINKWAGVRRVGQDEEGTQRVLKKTRVKAIKRFLDKNAINTIPVSVILAFDPTTINFVNKQNELEDCLDEIDINNGIGGKIEYGYIDFDFDPDSEEQDRPALIVDGQHRIKGMSEFDDEDLPIAVAAFTNADAQEQAFQFVVINNKVQKVKTDNVKAIIRDIDEENLKERLLDAGVSYGKWSAVLGDINDLNESPFKGILDWPLNDEENRKIKLTTIEHCLRYVNSIFPILEEDDETQKQLFLAVWRGIKEEFPALWLQDDKFMSKVNISAIHEYILDRMGSAYLDDVLDIYEIIELENYSRDKISVIPVEFWNQEWVHPLQDNAVIRGRIKDDLRKIAQNSQAGRDWDEKLNLIAQ